MTLAWAALATLLALAPKPPRAVGYSFAAGRCSEQVPAGGTEVRSRLAVGTTARLSAVFQFPRPCGSRGKPVPCRATPLEVKASGGIELASVRGTDIRLEARAAGPGAVAVRAKKKQFPHLAVYAAVPMALSARVSSLAVASPELRALRIVQGGSTTLSLYPLDESRRPLCAEGKLPVAAAALGLGSGAIWDLDAQHEVRAGGPPGWSFLDLQLGGRHLQLPIEIVSPDGIRRLELERNPATRGPIRVAVRAYDDTGEVVGAPVRLWLDGGSLVRPGRSEQPQREIETSDAEVAVVPARPGASMILSARMANGTTARLDLQAQHR